MLNDQGFRISDIREWQPDVIVLVDSVMDLVEDVSKTVPLKKKHRQHLTHCNGCRAYIVG